MTRSKTQAMVWQVRMAEGGRKDAEITFLGPWTPALLERMYYRSLRALRQKQVIAATEMAKKMRSELPEQEQSDD